MKRNASQSKRRNALYLFGPILLAVVVALIFSVKNMQPRESTYTKTKQQETGISLPPDQQGIYDSCVISDASCVQHLNTFAAGGFKLVMNYSQMYASATDQLSYAQKAHALGIKIIWSMNDVTYRNGGDLLRHYSNLAATCSCIDNTGFIAYVINLVKNLPVTYGYYIGDEVDPDENTSPGIHWLANLVKSLDPHHPRITVGASTNTPSEIYYYYPSVMADTAEVIGADYYPYGYITIGTSTHTLVSQVAQNLQSIANRYRKQYFMVLQAFPWSHLCHPWPSCAPFPSYAQMRAQRDQVLLHSHPRFILWYSYFELLQSDNPAKHWADLVAAAGAN